MGFDIYQHVYGYSKYKGLRSERIKLDPSEQLCLTFKQDNGDLYVKVRSLVVATANNFLGRESLYLASTLVIERNNIYVEGMNVAPLPPNYAFYDMSRVSFIKASLHGMELILVRKQDKLYLNVTDGKLVRELEVTKRLLGMITGYKELTTV